MKKVILLLFVFLAAGCSDSNKNTNPKHANWFFINFLAYEHKIDIFVNGKKYTDFDDGSGWDSHTSPLKEGNNLIQVRFHPKPERINKASRGSKISILLSPTMRVGSTSLPGVCLEKVHGYSECDIELVIKDKIPQTIAYVHKTWDSDKKKVLWREERIGTSAAFADSCWDSQTITLWTDQGGRFYEEYYVKGALDRAKYYKPDGTVGSEVKAGKGLYTEWYETGEKRLETPIVNGKFHGVEKLFSGDGKVTEETVWKNGEAQE